MFSSRFKWNLETNQLARLIEEKKRAGVKLLDLTQSNPTRAGFAYPETEILPALTQPQALQYDPHPRGLLSARQAIADYYQAHGQQIEAARIFLTASTSEAYSWLFKLLANQGEAMLVPQAAIGDNARGTFVYVVGPDQSALQVPVVRLYSFGPNAAVSGLAGDEKVITEGKQNLRPGAKVRLAEAAGERKRKRAAKLDDAS